MIFDRLENASVYETITPGFAEAFAFLRNAMQEVPAPGRYDICGSDVYANVMACTTAPAAERAWEAHQEYIDIQFLLKGEEVIGYTPVDDMITPGSYDPEHDILFSAGALHRGTCYLTPGCFAVLYPQDAHQPNCAVGAPSENLKIVVKVRAAKA